ncbi:hypothetical protein D3C71_1154940 [compost metagenome]
MSTLDDVVIPIGIAPGSTHVHSIDVAWPLSGRVGQRQPIDEHEALQRDGADRAGGRWWQRQPHRLGDRVVVVGADQHAEELTVQPHLHDLRVPGRIEVGPAVARIAQARLELAAQGIHRGQRLVAVVPRIMRMGLRRRLQLQFNDIIVVLAVVADVGLQLLLVIQNDRRWKAALASLLDSLAQQAQMQVGDRDEQRQQARLMALQHEALDGGGEGHVHGIDDAAQVLCIAALQRREEQPGGPGEPHQRRLHLEVEGIVDLLIDDPVDRLDVLLPLRIVAVEQMAGNEQPAKKGQDAPHLRDRRQGFEGQRAENAPPPVRIERGGKRSVQMLCQRGPGEAERGASQCRQTEKTTPVQDRWAKHHGKARCAETACRIGTARHGQVNLALYRPWYQNKMPIATSRSSPRIELSSYRACPLLLNAAGRSWPDTGGRACRPEPGAGYEPTRPHSPRQHAAHRSVLRWHPQQR